jgi:multidrug resistance efflux pump
MGEFKDELAEAVRDLDGRFDELKSAARQRLGDLFNEADYPISLLGLFDMVWDFPSVEPPDYLQRLNPQVYQQECQRAQTRFDEAVRLAETAFTEELAKLVDHLAERITGEDDGRPKVFRDSAIENLQGFFERFRSLNIQSNVELDDLVDRAQRVVAGVEPQQLRDSGDLRQQLATQLSSVQSSLDQMLVDRPRRNIIRRPR